MDVQELNDLFGIEDESQDGVVDQNDDATDEGAEELEDNELNQEGTAGDAASHQQSQEDNHQYAAARKAAEQREHAAKAEAQEAREQVKILQNVLREYGYEGTPQQIADALEASRSQRTIEEVEAERLEREQYLNEQIANHPDVVRARELAQSIITQRNNELIANEIRNIQRVNPEVKSVADLRNLGENQEYFDFLVKEKGLHIDKAYEKVMQLTSPQKSVKRDTRESIQTFNGSEGANVLDISKEEEALCMELNPGLTREEIRKYYNKYNKKGAK